MEGVAQDRWDSGEAYERYMGRWSRLVAERFVHERGVRPGSGWLDVGCGTGALSRTILDATSPLSVRGVDASPKYVASAWESILDSRASFEVEDAECLTELADQYDAVVSALMLNFLRHPERGATEMARVVREGGTVAAYVWDYSGGMRILRYFWAAASDLDPKVQDLDEGRRFSLCRPEALESLFARAGLREPRVWSIEVTARFLSFDDYWTPFLGGQGPAAGYLASLDPDRRNVLRQNLKARLPADPDGAIELPVRAWAVRGEG